MRRVVRTPPPPRAELVQQQAEEEERRRTAAAAKLAEIDRRIAQRKAEEAALACEAATADVVEPEPEPVDTNLADSSEPQLAVPSPQISAPTVTAASVPSLAAEDAGQQQPIQGHSAAPNAWIKPLSIAGSTGEEQPAVLDSVAPAVKSELDVISVPDSAASSAEEHAAVVPVATAENPDWESAPSEAVTQPAIDSLGHVDPGDGPRGQRSQRGRGRARAERLNDAASAADRYGMHALSLLFERTMQ